MSGIAGWVDFSRNPAQEHGIARAMTAALARRGPDGEGLWTAEHVALGHRRLAVADPGGPAQPLVHADGSGPRAVLGHLGRISNGRRLRAELAARGHEFSTDSDAETVLRGYLEWGPDVVTRLEGAYGFALWDVRREELLLVRDRMGVKPLFYAPTPAGVLFGSEPKAILAHPDFEPVLDAEGLRDILSVARVPGQAIFRGMREVRPGCVVRVTRAGTVEQRYWGLQVADHTDGLDATIGTVRALLETVVADQMAGQEPPCALLSGGLDSSTLTALAAQLAREQGLGPIRTVAVNDQDGTQGNDDHVYARLMAGHAGTEHGEISLAGLDLLDPALRAAVLGAYDVPLNKGDQYASLYRLFGTARQHAAAALSGECGDDVFGGYNWQRFPEWVGSGTYPWVHEGRPRFQGYGTLFDAGLLAELDLPAYEHDTHAAAVAEIAAGEHVADPAEARHREVTYLAHTRHSRVLFDRLDRLGMASGLEIRVPFADHRLVEYTFNIPWAMKSYDGREKSLLRAAMRDLLPDAVAVRVKTPYPNLRAGAYDQVLRERLAQLVRTGDSPLAPLLSADLTRAVGRQGAAALEGDVSRAALETALQLDSWLRTYRVRTAL
ncbi:asparagine synthase (glutamine-hydrolyzing) [Kitasatospora aureofaciens]|uniref:asparagine synthase (glutamine-hydrolyzing) n=1 Tax=Kitasatospora aureofaciens TaxID=1894 RepID=UPI00380929B0